MKKYNNIIINTDKYLGLLTLNSQDGGNSLNIETSKEIYEGLRELEMNTPARVILIQGNQKFFSPGADIKELSNLNAVSAKSKSLFNFFDTFLFYHFYKRFSISHTFHPRRSNMSTC